MNTRKHNLLKKPIIFFGTGRSGTTLISEIIFRHSDLAYPSNYHEKFPKYAAVGLFKHLFINDFWKFYGRKYQKGLNTVSRYNAYKFIPSEAWNMWRFLLSPKYDFSRDVLYNKEIDIEYKIKVLNYFSNLVSWQNGNRLAFKITGPPRMKFLSSIFPDAFFIHIKRNPVPTISSFLNIPFWKSRGIDKLWWHFDLNDEEKNIVNNSLHDPVWMTSFQISQILKIFKEEREIVKPNYFELVYEEFLQNPSDSIKQILSLVELEHDNKCYDYLLKNPIKNNCKPDSFYFNQQDLDTIYSFF